VTVQTAAAGVESSRDISICSRLVGAEFANSRNARRLTTVQW